MLRLRHFSKGLADFGQTPFKVNMHWRIELLYEQYKRTQTSNVTVLNIRETVSLLILFSFSFSLFLVYLYKCHISATLCGSCVSLTTNEYQCGWCPEKTSCTVNDDCSPQSWIEPNGKCRAKPIIMEVYSSTMEKHTQYYTHLENMRF